MKKQTLLFLGYLVLVSSNAISSPTGFADFPREPRKNPCAHITQRLGQGAVIIGKGIVGLSLVCATGTVLRDFISWTMSAQED